MTGIQAFILAAVRGHQVAKNLQARTARPASVGTLYKALPRKDRPVTGIQGLILAAMRDLGRSHGHEVAKNVEARTGRPVGVGTLYKTLHALERDGYLDAKWEEQPEVEYGRPRRRYYELTGLGARTLEAYIASQRETMRALRARRGDARA